ncbi:Cof-type HAD-IIB family hydrolase [Cellulomonas sp.]|uniref:Cof-type HAD-IIB family hydrolase n=1 Tax=Cellulomonas sp. TaxID=40001 RepID=UPI00258BAC52|nr:Cof-type HAD-IIB family hydrolase [Cellulomonas sp.]MCR6688951.1 Cof-type HAD-IIB family hydrolase [Cellulomonas sp.]
MPTSPTPAPDVRLVALDMDGSLLDDDKNLPESFWPVLEEMLERGIVVCPASGRQYATLREQFARDDLTYVAENGAIVVSGGRTVAVTALDPGTARDVVRTVRAAVAGGAEHGTVLCGERSAYVERSDDAFLQHVRPYYRRLELVEDLTAVQDTVLKVAVYDFGPAQDGAGPLLEPFGGAARVLVSGRHWVDVMHLDADKGAAVRAIQARLGIGPEHTMAFGDYLNDVGMLEAAHWSYAMANGHPEVLARARFVAPSNNEAGVVRTLVEALRLTPTAG